jgi:hypothetical protein
MKQANRIEIKKGIETNLIIYGVKHNHFWLLAFMSFGAFLIITKSIVGFLKQPDQDNGILLLTTICISIGCILILRIRFAAMAKEKKHSFPFIASSISNQDLLNYVS